MKHRCKAISAFNYREGRDAAEEKPHVCEQCCNSFSTPPVSTASHESSHWREALQFSQSSKSFCQPGTLHMKVHTGEKPYSCSQCSISFAESFNLNNHVRRVHAGERPFSCSQCAKIFFFSGELKKHVAVHNIQQISAEDILSVISNHCINL